MIKTFLLCFAAVLCSNPNTSSSNNKLDPANFKSQLGPRTNDLFICGHVDNGGVRRVYTDGRSNIISGGKTTLNFRKEFDNFYFQQQYSKKSGGFKTGGFNVPQDGNRWSGNK